MVKPLVFDATPIIYIIRASSSQSLRKLSGAKFLAQAVFDELLRGEALGRPEASLIRELVQETVLAVSTPSGVELVGRLVRLAVESEMKPLHRGEADAIALAKERGGIVISDDRVARAVAKLIHVDLHGTGYLVGRMYQEDLLTKGEAARKIGEMRKAGWRLREGDYRTIIDYLDKLK